MAHVWFSLLQQIVLIGVQLMILSGVLFLHRLAKRVDAAIVVQTSQVGQTIETAMQPILAQVAEHIAEHLDGQKRPL